MKKFIKFLSIFFLIFSCSIGNTFAWSSHGKITYQIVYDVEWLNKFSNITITEYSYGDIETEPYNPDFKIEYKDGPIGGRTDAITILSIYTDEPDWDMDDNLKLSPFQKLAGGSSGWRHQYYITFFGLIRLGKAPDRAQYFYNLSLKAFDRGDLYWGFRFFARALHYVEDLTQPLHSFPLPYSIVLKNILDLNGLIKIGENHHYALEDYQEVQIDILRKDYLEALKTDETFNVKTLRRLGVLNAFRARKDSGKIFRIQEKFYGKEINSKNGFSINKDMYKTLTDNEYQSEYDEIIKKHLTNFAKTVNTALKILYVDLMKIGILD
ncbi:MAG: hypothetical protein QMD25_04325 [Caldisericia bacterium]|jgi:hypothetical protein|nr:hypothetical protein [Caldisericia bacterium]